MTTTVNARSVPNYRAALWNIEPARSSIDFRIGWMGGRTRGRFTGFEGTIVTTEDLVGSSASVTIQMTSVDTGNRKRDEHLRSTEYLNVAVRPQATYRSTGVRLGEGRFRIDGELTLFGVTRQVPLELNTHDFTPARLGEQQAMFTATTRIDRREFGFKIPRDGGGWVVSNKVSIVLRVVASLYA